MIDDTSSSITVWNRIEPQVRSTDIAETLAAEVRDPTWFLARQWQVGEFEGQDGGSIAYVTLGSTSSKFDSWTGGGQPTKLFGAGPLERAAFSESLDARDISLQAEIGETFVQLLEARLLSDTRAAEIRAALVADPAFAIQTPPDSNLNPIDRPSAAFHSFIKLRSPNGVAVLNADPAALSNRLGKTDQEKTNIRLAIGDLQRWVTEVWGIVGLDDPAAWHAAALEFQVQAQVSLPSNTLGTLTAVPDSDGRCQWSSFDLLTATGAAPAAPVTNSPRVTVPAPVRFTGMPAPRFWDIESAEVSPANVSLNATDVAKVIAMDFIMIHGDDWFVVPYRQDVGSLVRIDSLVATDVFGVQTRIDRAGSTQMAPSDTRWTMFTNRVVGANGQTDSLSDFLVVPPTGGGAMQRGPIIEDVRFARDEMANMVWGIEKLTASPTGRPRAGSERDVAADARSPISFPDSADTTSPLRYQIESKVPVNWIPFVAVPVQPGSPALVLERSAVLRPRKDGWDLPAPAGRILNPGKVPAPYQIASDEVPRTGTTVQRVLWRCRWVDGTSFVWTGRRRQTGFGETQSGLRFDAATFTKNGNS